MTIDAILPQPRPPRELWSIDHEGTPRMVIGWRSDGTAILATARVFDTADDAARWQRDEEAGCHQDPEWHDQQETETR